MSKKVEGSAGEWMKHLRKEGKRQSAKGNRRWVKKEIRKEVNYV